MRLGVNKKNFKKHLCNSEKLITFALANQGQLTEKIPDKKARRI